jgi:plastocyanin
MSILRSPFRPIAIPVALGLAAACGYTAPSSSANPPPPAAMANDVVIVAGAQNKGASAFSPSPKTVALNGAPGVTVRWVNMDITGGDYTMGTAVVHTVVSDADPGMFPPSGNLGGNATYSAEFTAPGDYHYHCSIHPSMVGTIHVDP